MRGGRRALSALSERFDFFLRVFSEERGRLECLRLTTNLTYVCPWSFTEFPDRVIPIELLWGRTTTKCVFRWLSWRRDHCRTKQDQGHVLSCSVFREYIFFAMNGDTERTHGQNTNNLTLH